MSDYRKRQATRWLNSILQPSIKILINYSYVTNGMLLRSVTIWYLLFWTLLFPICRVTSSQRLIDCCSHIVQSVLLLVHKPDILKWIWYLLDFFGVTALHYVTITLQYYHGELLTYCIDYCCSKFSCDLYQLMVLFLNWQCLTGASYRLKHLSCL